MHFFEGYPLTVGRKLSIYENMNNCSYIKNKKQDVPVDVLFELSEFFKFFGDTTRIRIIHLMLSGELSVNEIADKRTVGERDCRQA